jgi:hypothetical protein
MSRWSDQAVWVGTTHHGGNMSQHRGLVVHIAEGFYDGTITWQKGNHDVSSHFIVGRTGKCAQMVDTDAESWAQRAGNDTWLSVECEGFTKAHPLNKQHPGWEALSDQQTDRIARLLVKAHQVYGVPLQVAHSPSDKGLGHHSMGSDWGHRDCPGAPIIAQKAAIVARARELAGVPAPAPQTVHVGVHDSKTVTRAQSKANAVPNTGADIKVDGDFGPKTEAKIKRVQAHYHLTTDGIVGPKTWHALESK